MVAAHALEVTEQLLVSAIPFAGTLVPVVATVPVVVDACDLAVAAGHTVTAGHAVTVTVTTRYATEQDVTRRRGIAVTRAIAIPVAAVRATVPNIPVATVGTTIAIVASLPAYVAACPDGG